MPRRNGPETKKALQPETAPRRFRDEKEAARRSTELAKAQNSVIAKRNAELKSAAVHNDVKRAQAEMRAEAGTKPNMSGLLRRATNEVAKATGVSTFHTNMQKLLDKQAKTVYDEKRAPIAAKTIINPVAPTVDVTRGAAAHDVANFPHNLSVISGGVPVAIKGDATATEIMGMADKHDAVVNGMKGVTVTLRGRFPVANVFGNSTAATVTVRSFIINPADPISFPLTAPAAKIFDCWIPGHVRHYIRTESNTSSVGRIVTAYDAEVTDTLPNTKLGVENMATSVAVAPWENSENRMPAQYGKRTAFYYISDDEVADGDERVTSLAKLVLCVADNTTGPTATISELWVEAEFHFFASTLTGGNSVPPPARFFSAAATNLGIVKGLMTLNDSTAHASVPGATSTLPGSNAAFSITAHSVTPSSSTVASFRVLLPFVGAPQTGGYSRPGSYVVAVMGVSLETKTASFAFAVKMV